MKLLITSVGSLIGQNILDSVENRRNLIQVIGLNSVAQIPRNFRCDKAYLVNRTESADFKSQFLAIVEEEKPDMILPGRDEDCVFLCKIKEEFPNLYGNNIPFGNSSIPQMMFDKYASYEFCKIHQLPFADTYLANDATVNLEGLKSFIGRNGYPIVAKPQKGFGSQGVYFALNDQHIAELSQDDVVFQEYLGDPADVQKFEQFYHKGIPLFFQLPEHKHYALQGVIDLDGELSELFFTINTLVFGRNEYIEQIFDKSAEEIGRRFAEVLYNNGWYGPINIQMKLDVNGRWKALELSPRHTGSTSGRLQLGFDEFGILCDKFIPEHKIPNLTQKQKIKGQVFKYLQDNIVLDEDVSTLESKKVWKKSKSKSDK